ncbi:MAG: rhomboid family intramembrane serine protease [Gemmatimonadota bacterium]
MSSFSFPRVTPWVGRLIAANAFVLLLMSTVLTSDRFADFVSFAPTEALQRPWTFLTYMFVHAGLLHLAANMLALYVFGAAVEARMGSRAFILYYIYCGIGAAVFALSLSLLHFHISPFAGASGAVMGVALAFAMFWPNAEIIAFPIPVPIKARTLVIGLALIDLVLARIAPDGVAHEAHIGGLIFGFIFFRLQSISRRKPVAQPRQVERVVMVQSASREADPHSAAPMRPIQRPTNDPVAAEVDRVLDKISANGMGSLTPEERRFLDEVSKRKQRDLN